MRNTRAPQYQSCREQKGQTDKLKAHLGSFPIWHRKDSWEEEEEARDQGGTHKHYRR